MGVKPDRAMLERLAANPHYKMSPEQVEALRTLRNSRVVQHNPSFVKHSTIFPKHDTKPKKSGDEKSN